MDVAQYCREIETYLCRKNDGHLIRVVGPSFDRVSGWAVKGVPLKIAFEGIDRYFERYYRQGPRRRPVKIDFCEADVLDVFDEWRRATGIISVAAGRGGGVPAPNGSPAADAGETEPASPKARQGSLPAHLERVLARLTNLRASGVLDPRFDPILDRLASELDRARSRSAGVRGEARAALLARLEALDRELLEAIQGTVDAATLAAVSRDAAEELAPFRATMAADVYERAHSAAIARLLRGRFGLPTISFA
jgi:hypothetical protein